MSDQISKWDLSFPSSAYEDACKKITLSHLKVEDEVSQTNFLDNNSPPTLLTLGIPGMENHELMIDLQQSQQQGKKTRSSPCHESLDRKSRGLKRKCGENIEHLVPEFDVSLLFPSLYVMTIGSLFFLITLLIGFEPSTLTVKGRELTKQFSPQP